MPKHDVHVWNWVQYIGESNKHIRQGQYLSREFTLKDEPPSNEIETHNYVKGISVETAKWVLANLPDGISKDDCIVSELKRVKDIQAYGEPIYFYIYLEFPKTNKRRYIVGLHSGAGLLDNDDPIEKYRNKPYFNTFQCGALEFDDAVGTAREFQEEFKQKGEICQIKMEEQEERNDD